MTTQPEKSQKIINNEQRAYTSWMTVVLTIIGLTVAAAVWASNQHADIRTWTADQDYVTKQELERTIEKRYVPKEDFAKVQQCMEGQKEDITDIKNKVDKIFELVHSNRGIKNR